jgi:hypothetical protein
MRGRLFIAVGALAALSVISVPAQQRVAPDGRFAVPAGRVLRDAAPSFFTTVEGSALADDSSALPHQLVRLRDAGVGRIVRTQLTDEDGLFRFKPVDPGSYIVELLQNEVVVLAASALVHVNAGEVAQTIVRKPRPLTPLESVIRSADAHADAVVAAAAASGILTSRVPGDDVSPR